MVDINRISGPGSPTEPPGGKSKPTPGKEFEQYFKVGETDPEQKKKKQEKEAEKKKKKAEQILQAGSTIHKETPAENIRFPKKPKIEKIGESEKRQPQTGKQREEGIQEIREAVKAENIAAKKILPEKKEAPPEKKEKGAPVEKRVEEYPLEELPPPPAPPPQPEPEVEEEPLPFLAPPPEKKEPEKEEAPAAVFPIQPEAPSPLFIPASSGITPGYASLRAEILALFERMVSVISVMHDAGITETTIHLTSEMAGSMFAGAQIVIREFSTAPKAFNIEFIGNAQNTALFEQNVASLLAAFQSGNYNFSIHRLESSLLPAEKPMFHRKEKPGEKGDKGERDRKREGGDKE